MILIGSRALALRNPSSLMRKPVDFDWVCTQAEYEEWIKTTSHKVEPTKIYSVMDGKKQIVEGSTNCEFEIIQPNTSSAMFQELVSSDPETIETKFGLIPSFDLLFAIKTSHRYLKNSPHFFKTLIDYHIMKSLGAVIRPEHQEFLKLREKETYNYAYPKLNQTKDNFFKDDAVQYVYDHDTIHESIKLYERPAYTYYMKDGAQVQTSKKKFFEVSHDIRIAGVIEEAAVLAIERSLVPHPGVKTPKEAWQFALSKVCSSITSGWFREFAYENALEVLKKYPIDYFDRFQKALSEGYVKPFTGSKY